MNCLDAEIYLSALCDGERVPSDAAQHVAQCGVCHRILDDYSRMGAELRLAAAAGQTGQLPVLPLPAKETFWQFLGTGIRMPRFAAAGLIACVVVATSAAVLLRAQSRPLWFEFSYGLQQGASFTYRVAQNGFKDAGSVMGLFNGSPGGVDYRIEVKGISANDVALRVRAAQAKLDITSTGFQLLPPNPPISLDGVAVTHYRPGETLTIPVDGGGTLYLKGEVFDHQPKIAFGLPLEPEPGTMIVRSPVLTQQDKLIGQSAGSSASIDKESECVFIDTPKDGKFTFALRSFPGAVKAEANWGQIKFKLGDQRYRLVAAAPVTGGDQPHTVWVRHDDAPPQEYTDLGGGPLQ